MRAITELSEHTLRVSNLYTPKKGMLKLRPARLMLIQVKGKRVRESRRVFQAMGLDVQRFGGEKR